jgi:hypothetical protein
VSSLAWARTVCAASMVNTHPPTSTGRARSSGANSGTSLVFAPISRSAITTDWPGGRGQQVRDRPSAPMALRIALPSTAIAGNSTGPASGAPVAPIPTRAAR